jgi:hypothetical protein
MKTQLVDPTGGPLAEGDSILISLVLDRQELKVEFLPHGLVFAGKEPMELAVWYVYGNLTNGEGKTESDLDIWYQAFDGAPWSDLNALHPRGQALIADVYHFSNFAVAW